MAQIKRIQHDSPDASFQDKAMAAIERAREASHEGPEAALAAAEEAIRAAERASASQLEQAVSAGLRAEAWAQYANALRVSEAYDAAEKAWRAAERAFRTSLQDASLKATMLTMKALLRSAQQEFDRSLLLLRRARTIYRKVGSARGLARVELSTAWTYSYNSKPQRALKHAVKALELVDPYAAPENALGAMHLVTLCLIDAGETRYAHHYLSLYERAYALAGGMIEVRSWWLKARLGMASKQWSSSAKVLEALRREFLERNLPYDAALATVDLCVCYAEEGRSSAVWSLAQEMYPIFISMKVPAAASAALLLFIDAARATRPRLGELLELAQKLEPIRRRDGR